jgi:hypothetical protein
MGVVALVLWAACGGWAWGSVWWSARASARAWPSACAPASPVLGVPRAPASIALDGDLDDPGWVAWPGPARTGPFVDASGAPARPHAEARLLWGDGVLYLLLYAADEDVTRADRFRLAFERGGVRYVTAIAADGVVRDEAPAGWESEIHASREIDGTLDDPRDVDEEWSLEVAVPLTAIGLRGLRAERFGFPIARCDPAGCSRADPRVARELLIE